MNKYATLGHVMAKHTPSTILGVLHVLTHLNLSTPQGGGYYYYSYFIHEENEGQLLTGGSHSQRVVEAETRIYSV